MSNISRFHDVDFANKAIALYKDGKQVKEISETLKIPQSTLIQCLKRLGYIFDRSISRRIYTLDRHFFNKIDTKEKAYWLGLIYADGSNKISQRVFAIGLQECDKDILILFNKDINSNNTLKDYNKNRGPIRKKMFYLMVHCKIFCEDLLKHGVFQNKTFTLNKPNINKELFPHFIRGYFDGDGGLVSNKHKITGYIKDSANFTGTREVLEFISEQCTELGIHTCFYKRHKNRDNNNFTITVSGRLNVVKLCEYMYRDCGNHKLVRKYEKFLKMKNRYEKK